MTQSHLKPRTLIMTLYYVTTVHCDAGLSGEYKVQPLLVRTLQIEIKGQQRACILSLAH